MTQIQRTVCTNLQFFWFFNLVPRTEVFRESTPFTHKFISTVLSLSRTIPSVRSVVYPPLYPQH